MKALQIIAPEVFEIKEVPVPEPGPGQVLMKVLAVTTCPHWDMHILGGIPMLADMPLQYPYMLGQPGHEACGDIAAVGSEVSEQLVDERVCTWRDQGHHRQGCYAQYVVVEAENVVSVPKDLDPVACAPLELAMCAAAHVLYAEKLDAIAGKTVGVFGLGPAGLVFLQLAKASGAKRVVGFDPIAERREMALKLGADQVVDPLGPEGKAFPKRSKPDSLYCTFDCVGTPAAVHQAMGLTSNLLILFAVQREPYIFSPEYWPGMALVGTQPHTRQAADYAAKRLREGTLDLGSLVTHRLRLEDYAQGVELLRKQEAVKVAFLPNEA